MFLEYFQNIYMKSFLFAFNFITNFIALKRLILLYLLLQFSSLLSAQQLYLRVESASAMETATIDSVGYVAIHQNAKLLSDEANLLLDKLKNVGYISSEVSDLKKTDDSSFVYSLNLGKQIKSTHIYIGKNSDKKQFLFKEQRNDSVIIPFDQTQTFLNRTLAQLEAQGFSLAKVNLGELQIKGSVLLGTLEIEWGQKRKVNDLVVVGYDKFPKGHLQNIKRLYRNKTFNRETLNNINTDFQKFRFVSLTKYPEILFKQDTTKVYVYLEKAKPNRFDGFIGFSNEDNANAKTKINFNGYLDLLLINTINLGESFSIYWKSDGKEQKSFDAAIELPYLFRTPFGIKANLNIFKQDSTFQNTKTALELGYFLNYNTRFYLGYQTTESSDIQNTRSTTISDFNNAFVTATAIFFALKQDDFLFPEKTNINLRGGFGSRNSKLEKNSQIFGELNFMHNLYLNPKNIFNIKSQNFYLQSENYILSELHRFGGINSIRGFNENSLQAATFASILTEYRYVITPSIYIHTIIDYGFFKDPIQKHRPANENQLLGLGVGFGILTKNGLFNLIYANGTIGDQSIKASNSIVHISFKAKF